MPRQVDHRERRLLIADAVMRLANEHGLDEVSLRHVATAAGVSSGMVQYYFRTKDEMMVFALSVVRPAVAALLHEDIATSRALVAAQIRTAQKDGCADPRVDPDRAAVALPAVAEGMNYYLIGGHYDAPTARAALETQLDLIFTT